MTEDRKKEEKKEKRRGKTKKEKVTFEYNRINTNIKH